MKTMLVPFVDDDLAAAAFDVAAELARSHDSYIEGLFVLRPPQIFDGEGIALAGSYLTQLREEGARLAQSARTRFEACVGAAGFAMGSVSAEPGQAVAAWREAEGLEGQVVGEHGRLFDLIVVGRGFGDPWLDWTVLCESALFESGRPVLVTPQNPSSEDEEQPAQSKAAGARPVGRRVTIAWNGSTETSRTIALAMPLLLAADAVQVLAVTGWGVPGPSAELVGQHLSRHGVKVEVHTAPSTGKAVGETIVESALGFGADLLVKGAYTQSRLRQMVFGGATRYLLNSAPIPVFFVH